ncbi:hypothetical protein ACP4OV_008759 [Aristida adscensionis]
MGVQSNEGQVMLSSIVLLQQRFRELEKIREKREERLLLPTLLPRPGVPTAAAAAPRETPTKWFFHPELLYPCRPLRETAAALFPAVPSTACECKNFQPRGDKIAMELWPSKGYNKHASGEVDVDTSLHL